jgi:GNAT superfamily N-acetyltransferase
MNDGAHNMNGHLLIPQGLDHKKIAHRFSTGIQDPSEIYHACKEVDGFPATPGTLLIWACRVLKFYRLNPRQFFYEPLSNYERLLDVARLNNHLHDGGAPIWALAGLSVTMEVFESCQNPPIGQLPLPQTGEKSRGLHCVRLTNGWKESGECLQFQNSWGSGWGDKGCGWLSRNYIDRYMTEAWLVQNVRFGLTMYKYANFMKAPDTRESKRIWMIENPRSRIRVKFNSSGHQSVLYNALSVESDCPVDVLEIRNGRGLRICWAHLFHLPGIEPRVSVLKEFFVWPWFRRQGYGRKLEEIACEQARMWGSKKIEVYFHQADTTAMSHRVAGYHFSKSCGYSKNYRDSKLPNLTAIGEKYLSDT